MSNSGYYYDKCTVYHKADVLEYLNSPQSRKTRKVNKAKKTGWYYVKFEGSVPQVWRNAVDVAITAWNNKNGHIRFKKTSSHTVGTLTIKMGSLASTTVASISHSVNTLHHNGTLGNSGTITINNSSWASGLVYGRKKLSMVHEFGHFVGLHHFHVNPSASAQGVFLYTEDNHCNYHNIEGNVDYEKPVMRTPIPENETYGGLSDCDVFAYEAIYERCFIRSQTNGKYLCSENGGWYAKVNRSNLGPWEKFKLKYDGRLDSSGKPDNSYSILGNNNKYADLNTGNYRVWFDQSDRYNGHSKWLLEKASSGHEHYRIRNTHTWQLLNSHNGNEVECQEGYHSNGDVWFIHRLVDCGYSGECN